MKLFRFCGQSNPLRTVKKNVICGIFYRQHNSPEIFQSYFDETIEKLASSGKHIVIMGDFDIDLLKCASSSYSQDFFTSLQSCYLVLTIDKPTRVHSTSATLTDNIFIAGFHMTSLKFKLQNY